MSRSSPSAPLYLQGAISAVERLLAERYPDPMTARQIAVELHDRGFRWPLPQGFVHRRGQTRHRNGDEGDPTTERVRRVCELQGNRTVIARVDRERPAWYSIYPWAIERVRARV